MTLVAVLLANLVANAVHGRLAYVEALGQFLLGGWRHSDFNKVGSGKASAPVLGSQTIPAREVGMLLVAALSCPFKIVASVVRLVEVAVVDVVSSRTRPDKGLRNERVDGASKALIVAPKVDDQIAVVNSPRLTNCATYTAHVPEVGNLVIESRDRKPLFVRVTPLVVILVAAFLSIQAPVRASGDLDLADFHSIPLPPLPETASVFSPPNQRWIAYAEYNRVIPEVARTATLTWRATDNYGWSGWRNLMARSLNTGSDYQFSLGNVLAPWIQVRESRAGELAFTNQRAETAGFTAANCGGSFAVACAHVYDSLPVRVIYNASAMVTYIFTGQAAVAEHEEFHALTNACDQYRGGCPPTDVQGSFVCTGNQETLMDCGLAARYPQFFDIITFLGAYTPDHVSFARAVPQDGGINILWNCERQDGGFAAAFRSSCHVATETAFAFARRGEEPTWVGWLGCGEQYGFCYTDDQAGQRWFDGYWVDNFDCAYIRLENPATRMVPQSSSLGLNGSEPAGWFQSAGCWRG